MQYDAKTPDEYLKMLADDWRREKLEELRALIIEKAPDFEEGIGYKMLSYGDSRGVVFHLNAQKNHVGLYVGNAKKIDPDGGLLAGIDVGKGCLRFKKSSLVSETRIDEFIAKTVELWKRGDDIAC